jgi:site-specific recombinase XerD
MLRDDLDTFHAERAATDWAPSSAKTYGYDLGRFATWLEQHRLRRWPQVTPDHFDAFLKELHDRGMSLSTRTHFLWLLRTVGAWLLERGKVLVDPARHLDGVVDGEPPLPPPPLSEVQVAKLFDLLPLRDAIDLRNRLHIDLCYSAGLRLRESINLDVTDIDLHERFVLVRHGKGNKDRVVPLLGGVLGSIKDYMAVRRELLRGPDHGALLIDAQGKRVDYQVLGKLLRRVSRVLGVRVHPHLLRHSVALAFLRRGMDIRYIQQFLGHSSPESTKIYLRLVPGHLREDYDAAMPTIAVEP